jgi:putative ABC transport system permease protein
MIDLALKNLIHDKFRFLITVSGVAFSVLLVVVQLGIFDGLMNNADIIVRRFGADIWVTSYNAENVDFPHFFPESWVLRVRSIPGVLKADNLMVETAQLTQPSGATELVLAFALDNSYRWNFPWYPLSGNRADLRRGRYIMIDESGWHRLGHFEVGDYREIEAHRFKIIGKTRDARSFTDAPIVFMDYDSAHRLVPASDATKTAYIVVKLAPGAGESSVISEIRRRLPHNDVYTAAAWAQKSRAYWVRKTALGLDMYVTVFLGCMVGVVIVAQTLYTSTMDHLREFGTLKAIGGSNADIYGIIARQAVIAAVAGFALGLGLALGFSMILSHTRLDMMMTPQLLVVVALGTVALCVAAAMLSFRKVAAIDPALVFRS